MSNPEIVRQLQATAGYVASLEPTQSHVEIHRRLNDLTGWVEQLPVDPVEPPVDPPVDPDPGGPSIFVKRLPMIGLKEGRKVSRPDFSVDKGNSYVTPAGETTDLRGREAVQHKVGQGPATAVRWKAGAGACLTGFTTRSAATPWKLTWKERHGNEWHNDKGIRVDEMDGDAYLEGISLIGAGIDGIGTPTTGNRAHRLYVNGLYAVDIGDDPFQNDNFRKVSVSNFYCQGHVGLISQRPGRDSAIQFDGSVTEIKHGLIHCKRQPYDTDEKGTDSGHPGSKRKGPFVGAGHDNEGVVGGSAKGWAHKWWCKIAGNTMIVDMDGVLIVVSSIPVEGPKQCPWPKGDYKDVTVVWLGGGDWPMPKPPAGVKVMTDIDAGWKRFKAEEAKWYKANGWNGRNLEWNRL